MTVGQNSAPPHPLTLMLYMWDQNVFYSDQDLETGTQWILF